MCSNTIKHVSCLLTPIKSPVKSLLPPSLKIGNVDLSPQSLSVCSTAVKKLSKQFLSPNWSPPKDSWKNKEHKSEKYLTPQFPTAKTRGFVQENKTSRCLFSPVKCSREVAHHNHFFTPTRNTEQCLTIPLFDTPYRTLLSPSRLDRKIKRFVLGKGSFGVVVKGTYKNEHVAVKIIPKTKSQNAQDSLEKEKNALKLKHPNIVEVFQVTWQTDVNMGFVFMELYDHNNLEHLLQNEIMPFTIKLKYIQQTGSALEYCHKNGILHLDVKPKNIIVCLLNNTCKLCDFGSSANVTESRKLISPAQGTLKYCAPELLRGEIATEKADVYSFGITMWQIVHQEVPYEDEDLHVVAYKVVTQKYRPRSINSLSTAKNNITSVYEACWEAEPIKRPPMSYITAILNQNKLEKCN